MEDGGSFPGARNKCTVSTSPEAGNKFDTPDIDVEDVGVTFCFGVKLYGSINF